MKMSSFLPLPAQVDGVVPFRFNRFDDEVVAVLVVVLLRVLDWVVASLFFYFLNGQCWLLLHDDDDDNDHHHDNDHVHKHEHEHNQHAYYFDHYHVHYVDYQHVHLETHHHHHHHHHHDHYHLIIMITISILITIISTIICKIIKLFLLLLLYCIW